MAERSAADERLKALPAATDKQVTSAQKQLRDVLGERLKWLDEWDKAVKERTAAENPKPSPAEQAAGWKSELERLNASLGQAVKNPDGLLPASFRNLPAEVSEANRTEMSEAIDAAQGEFKDWSSKLEQLRADPSRKDGAGMAALRARRDKTHQRLTGLKARNLEREAALAEAKTPEARGLARDRLVNVHWETRVEAERLRAVEAMLALEAKRNELAALNLQVLTAHVQLAKQTLDRMKLRFRSLAAREERDLQRAAKAEKTKAKRTEDPVDKFRAKRNAELLELQAKVIDTESLLKTSTAPSLEEQRALADRAQTDFSNVKKLLDDGKVSHLDALRLNNDFRRIGAERSRILDTDLAIVAVRLAAAENALSSVELEILYDSRDDRFELDGLLERLPKSQHARAIAVFEELERSHMALLMRRRDALQKLADRTEETHEQVERRLRILAEHFGFIRTNIFWVRDEEPLAPGTLLLAHREAIQLARVAIRMAEEFADRSVWGYVSVEFVAAVFGLVVLPLPLHRLRRVVRTRRPPPAAVVLESSTG